jgi:hypothetical protein
MRVNTNGLEPHPGAHDMPRVQGACPACRRESLFLSPAGIVMCAEVRCADPYAPSQALESFALPVLQVEQLPLDRAS